MRGKDCTHLQPVCLKSLSGYVGDNTQKENGMTQDISETCSLCGCVLHELVVDQFIDSILNVASEDTVQVNILSDGRFEELNMEMLPRQQQREEKVHAMASYSLSVPGKVVNQTKEEIASAAAEAQASAQGNTPVLRIMYGPANQQVHLDIKRLDLDYMDEISEEGMTTVGQVLQVVQLACRSHGWVAVSLKFNSEMLHPLDFIEECVDVDHDEGGEDACAVVEALTMPLEVRTYAARPWPKAQIAPMPPMPRACRSKQRPVGPHSLYMCLARTL